MKLVSIALVALVGCYASHGGATDDDEGDDGDEACTPPADWTCGAICASFDLCRHGEGLECVHDLVPYDTCLQACPSEAQAWMCRTVKHQHECAELVEEVLALTPSIRDQCGW